MGSPGFFGMAFGYPYGIPCLSRSSVRTVNPCSDKVFSSRSTAAVHSGVTKASRVPPSRIHSAAIRTLPFFFSYNYTE